MTEQEIRARLKAIKLAAPHDYEVAHTREDALFADFIRHVATRRDAAGRKARIVLQSTRIKFFRVSS